MGRCIREPSDNYETKEHDAMSAVTWKNFHKLTALRARTTSSSKIQHIPPELTQSTDAGRAKEPTATLVLSGARQETESLNTNIELEQVDGNVTR